MNSADYSSSSGSVPGIKCAGRWVVGPSLQEAPHRTQATACCTRPPKEEDLLVAVKATRVIVAATVVGVVVAKAAPHAIAFRAHIVALEAAVTLAVPCVPPPCAAPSLECGETSTQERVLLRPLPTCSRCWERGTRHASHGPLPVPCWLQQLRCRTCQWCPPAQPRHQVPSATQLSPERTATTCLERNGDAPHLSAHLATHPPNTHRAMPEEGQMQC
mmetsp:Transcript_148961/g.415085  ORF Transcript_148961/g.415085 Transcript_148961/m.415085 type:complete len:217 (-) Transcript_148961:379-1029(-)